MLCKRVAKIAENIEFMFPSIPIYFQPEPSFISLTLIFALLKFSGISSLAKSAFGYIEHCLVQRPLFKSLNQSQVGIQNGGVLIGGPRGVGKTSFIHALCERLRQPPNYAWSEVIECKKLRGKSCF